MIGLAGQFFTRCVPGGVGARLVRTDACLCRGLYTDSEVTYARRLKSGCPCCGGRLKPVSEDPAAPAEAPKEPNKTG